MSGISSKAESTLQNNKKYNGIEFDEDLGLNIYEAFYRHLDPQTGRWWEIDPKIDAGYENITPYNSMFNDPIRYSDFLGDDGGGGWWDKIKSVTSDVVDATLGAMTAFNDNSTMGLNNQRANNARAVRNVNAYNKGQDIGDAVSIGVGAAELVLGLLGTAAAGGGSLVTGGLSGLAIPAALALTAHGGITALNGATNLLSQKGRVHSEETILNQNGGGKNGQHSNQKARESAKDRYESVKKDLDQLKKKPNKTKEDKEQLKKLEKSVKHEKQKMDNTGENHSQKAKGSN